MLRILRSRFQPVHKRVEQRASNLQTGFMEPVTLSRSRSGLIRSLEQKKFRKKEGLFLAEGSRLIDSILDHSPEKIRFLVVMEGMEKTPKLPEGIECFSVSRKDYRELTRTENPQGILAVVKIPDEIEESELLGGTGVLLCLDAIQDPGNLGTILRSALWFGVRGVVLGEGCVDPFSPKVVRSLMGDPSALSMRQSSLPVFLDRARREDWSLFLFQPGTESLALDRVRFPDRSLLVIGNEARGISPELPGPDRILIRIPGEASRGVESLNAATSASIALYHACVLSRTDR